MNKTELIGALAQRTGLARSDALKVVEALFDVTDGIISQALRSGDKIQITGFGSFETKHRAARTGRNPRTGKDIQIAASTSAAFRGGKGLRDALQG